MTHINPLALSLSKGCPFFGCIAESEGQGFDKLSPVGISEEGDAK